jgi:hypothetical protein
VETVMIRVVPLKLDNFLTSWETVRVCVGLHLEKKEIPDDVPWIHSLPFPGDISSAWSQCAQRDILKIMFKTSTS